MKDTWCEPILVDGHWVYGGAARNVRLSEVGGMDAALKEMWMRATVAAEKCNSSNVVPLRRRRIA
jgi:hypothetical protein